MGWAAARRGECCHTGDVTYEAGDAWDHTAARRGECCHTGDVTYEAGDAWDRRRLDVAGVVTPEM